MFEFFIALFGGAYYAGKYAKDKADMRRYEQRAATKESVRLDIQSRYAADDKLEAWAKDFIASGKHFDEICDWFEEDFKYVLGSGWMDKLTIPKYRTTQTTVYSMFSQPSSHAMWVYHLLLAKQGKIDQWVVFSGFPIGGTSTKDTNIKFAQCIEGQLLNAGVRGVRLSLELNPGNYITPSSVCGGRIKIESLCNYPTYRLWDDYIQK